MASTTGTLEISLILPEQYRLKAATQTHFPKNSTSINTRQSRFTVKSVDKKLKWQDYLKCASTQLLFIESSILSSIALGRFLRKSTPVLASIALMVQI